MARARGADCEKYLPKERGRFLGLRLGLAVLGLAAGQNQNRVSACDQRALAAGRGFCPSQIVTLLSAASKCTRGLTNGERMARELMSSSHGGLAQKHMLFVCSLSLL